MRGVTFAGKFFVSFVFAANLAVMSLRTASFFLSLKRFPISNILTAAIIQQLRELGKNDFYLMLYKKVDTPQAREVW